MKICGLTRLEDVVLARDLGAWALGFVFAPSPRRLTPAAARGLVEGAGLGRSGAARGADSEHSHASVDAGALAPVGSRVGDGGPALPLTVGVFGDCEAGEIASVAEEVGLDAVQLHGLAGPRGNAVRTALAAQQHSREHPILVIQAVSVASGTVDSGALREAVAAAREEADIVLLDTGTGARVGGMDRVTRFGGTGKAFPWRLAREVEEGCAVLVAGGIGPGNVREALREAAAWGVDVSSGIELSPGVKDARLMERLVALVREGRDR